MARTTRTCSLGLLLLGLNPLQAEAQHSRPSALALYAQARIAAGMDQTAAVADKFDAALSAAPDQKTVALHAYRQGVVGGNYALALRAARTLERLDFVPPDARLLLYIAALHDRDWAVAGERLNDLARKTDFGFMVPIFAEWLALGSGEPVATFTNKTPAAGDAYAQENRPLLMLAGGNTVEGTTMVKALWPHDSYRAQSLRLIAAATLAGQGQRDAALSLLLANDQATASARSMIGKGQKLDFDVDSPASGAAFLLSRMAGDLIVQGSARAAVTLSRLAQFADPKNPRIALIAAGAFAADKDESIALGLANRLRKDSVYGSDAASLRIDMLEALGDVDQALAEGRVRARSGTVNDLARIGDIEARRGRYAEAATIYQKALATKPDPRTAASLSFATGNALNRTGDWKSARPYLERALTQMPGDPALLIELGFGLIDHGEDKDRALKFLVAAARLKPDSAEIMDSLAWAHYRLGNNDLAIDGLEHAVTLDEAEPEIDEHLGDAYWRGGRHVDARYAWRAARVRAEGTMAARLDSKIDRGMP